MTCRHCQGEGLTGSELYPECGPCDATGMVLCDACRKVADVVLDRIPLCLVCAARETEA